MKIAFFETTADDLDQVSDQLSGHQINTSLNTLQDDLSCASDAAIISIFVDSRVNAEALDQLPQLKHIATRSTGFDHIDLAACQSRGISVSNVPSYGENTVAEHAFALILALSRKIFQSYERTERFNFNRQGLEGFDLYQKTLGIIGCGRIGQHSARIGNGFGMRVIASDVHQDQELAKHLNFSYADSLEELLAQSDVITVHVPYIPQATHHLINQNNIDKIKPGAILVNTSRGAIVETQAILHALENKILAGAGLDVLEEENHSFDHLALLSSQSPAHEALSTALQNHMLIARDDVIITPHNAFNSVEARQRILETTLANIAAFLHNSPQNIVSENLEGK